MKGTFYCETDRMIITLVDKSEKDFTRHMYYCYSKEDMETLLCRIDINNGRYKSNFAYGVLDECNYGKGLMSEAVEVLKDEVIENRIQACASVKNTASVKILDKVYLENGGRVEVYNDVRYYKWK